MKTFKTVFVGSCLMAVAVVMGCKQDKEPIGKEVFVFSGTVHDGEKLLAGVDVWIGDFSTQTEEKGQYVLEIPQRPETGRFVLNATMNGFGMASRVYSGSATNESIELKPATVVQIDITQPVMVQSSNSNCNREYGNPLESKVVQPKLYRNGVLADFRVPQSVADIISQRNDPNSCAVGATVSFPANAVVNTDGSDPSVGEDIFISLISLDPLTAGGMPGDMSARVDERRDGYMESFGAVAIELYGDEKEYKLRDGTTAQITVPVNPYIKKESIPSKIPLLSYNREDGFWYQEGSAAYDQELNAYVGEVSHFSEFNMDMLKVDQACATFCLTALNDDAASTLDIVCGQDNDTNPGPDNNTNSEVRITAIAPSGATYTRTDRLQCNTCTQASLCNSSVSGVERSCLYNYSIYNLFPGPDSFMLIEHFEPASSPTSDPILKGLYVIEVGGTKLNSTNLIPGCGTDPNTAYSDCQQFIPVKIPEEGDPDYIGSFDTIPLALNQITGTTARVVFLYDSDPSLLTFEYSTWDSSLPAGATCNECGDPASWGGGAFSPLSTTSVPVDPDEDLTPDYWIVMADITGLTSTVQYAIKIREQASGKQSTCVYAAIP